MKASHVFAAMIALILLLTPILSFAEVHNTAHLQAFIQNDPLQGDNGLDTNHLAPLIYGPINIGFDMDGNALEAIDQQDFFYANGYYYLIGKSFMEGTFAYAPGVPHTETVNTTPATFYRWGGLVTYRSKDLENWEFVNRLYVQEEGTGRHIVMYKPRMCYSAATGKYVLWVLHKTDSSDPEAPILVMTADSPEGPWSDPQPPTMPEGMVYSDLTHDYQIKVDPNTGIGWFTQAGAKTQLFRMTPEMTGVEKDFSFKVKQFEKGNGGGFGSFGTNPLAGGMGLFYREGWWYIFGTPQCGNCVGTQVSYVMARSPEGPWLSPDTMTADEEVVPSVISTNGLYSQTHGASMFPDENGNIVVLGYGTHYRSSETGISNDVIAYNASGDNSLALSGQFWFTFEFEEDGRIKELTAKEYYEIPLAEAVDSEHVKAYQADVSITSVRSARQTFTVEPGTEVACVLPSVFQITPDESPADNKLVAQDPLVNAPLTASLKLPDDTVYTWTIDARCVGFAPRQVALNLPEVYTEGGTLELTLSTKATNGGYGVALGVGNDDTVYAHVDQKGKETIVTEYAGHMMYLRTSDKYASAPVITTQPVDVTVTEGTKVGFLTRADGIGVGYQWYHNGQIVMPHGVTPGTRNEAVSAALRLAAVTMEDAGEYTCEAINSVGSAISVTVTLTVLPKEDK